MNAERLHVVARTVLEDLRRTKLVATFEELTTALQNQINQPNQAEHQQSVAAQLDELKSALSTSTSNSFSPAWQEILVELDGFDLLGERLLGRVLGVFERNQITPAAALEELQEMLRDLKAFEEDLTRIREAFGRRGIGKEDLEAGEAEIGFLIPRQAVDNELASFGKDLVRLQRTMAPFNELALGSRPGMHIRTISSTEFMVFLDAAMPTAGFLALAVERVVALYKDLLEIRRIKGKLAERGVSNDDLSGIERHAEQHMTAGIEPLIEELLARSNVEPDRANELRKELRISLNDLANRIDRGYNVEVRVEPLPEPKQAEDGTTDVGEEELVTREWVDLIRKASRTLEFIRAEGEPILRLPSGEDHGDDEGEAEDGEGAP